MNNDIFISNNILIVIDFQNDFVTGPLGTPEAIALIPKIEKYVNECRNKGYTIWWTKDEHYNVPSIAIERKYIRPHCFKGTEGCEIVNNLNQDDTAIITKNTFAFSYWDYALDMLGDPSITFEIIGVCTDICVISNALMIRSICPVCNASTYVTLVTEEDNEKIKFPTFMSGDYCCPN